MNRAKLKGRRFTRLIVIKESCRNNKFAWYCKCDCGNSLLAFSNELTSGATRSCGCLHKESIIQIGHQNRLPGNSAAFNSIYHDYKRSPKRRGIPFALSKKQFKKIIILPCYYCKAKPNNVSKTRLAIFIYNGIDRLRNDIGYTVKNSVPCCKLCNRAKLDLTLLDFITWIDRLITNRNNLNVKN